MSDDRIEEMTDDEYALAMARAKKVCQTVVDTLGNLRLRFDITGISFVRGVDMLGITVSEYDGTMIPDGHEHDSDPDFCAEAPWKAAVLDEILAIGSLNEYEHEYMTYACRVFRGEIRHPCINIH